MRNLRTRFAIMNFMQFAVWGSYLTSMGTYLFSIGMGEHIGMFYAMQGIVSLFMPALMGILADRYVPAQKLLSACHIIAAAFMIAAGYYGMTTGSEAQFATLFTLYSCSVAFYMPTLSLSNSVAYSGLEGAGLDPVKRVSADTHTRHHRFHLHDVVCRPDGLSAELQPVLRLRCRGSALRSLRADAPPCPVNNESGSSVVQSLGLDAFKLFKQKRMAIFFIFSMLLGVSLQITNGFANTYITSFGSIAEYQGTFGVEHANMLISLSQVSETLCILLIPFVMSRFGIKRVMIIAMLAWVFRFGLFGFGNPGSGVWMFVLSMIVYGVAFDFFNVSGSLFVNQEVSGKLRSSAQGLFVLMTNGVGATVGTLGAQAVINNFVDMTSMAPQVEGWQTSWLIFAGYALAVALLFMVVFDSGKKRQPTEKLTR